MIEGPESSNNEPKAVEVPSAVRLAEVLKDHPYITYREGKFEIRHEEFQAFLTPKILKIGDSSRRGVLLASYNAGLTNVDEDTFFLHKAIATIMVSFSDLPKDFDPFKFEDANLVVGLYLAAKAFNDFFRKTAVGVVL